MKLRQSLSRVSIKWRIFAVFAGFTAIILTLLWVFQIVFLNDFYKAIKIHSIKNSSKNILQQVDSDDFQDFLQKTAWNSQTCILVTDQLGRVLYSEHTVPDCVIHRLTPMSRMVLYDVAEQNGGSYFERFVRNDFKMGQGVPNIPHSEEGPEPESIVYAFLATRKSGSAVMILLNSTISPVSSTVQTLRVQLACITGLMVVLSLGLALLLSRHISRPIIRINEAAKEMADGNYAPLFHTDGYREIAELGQTLNYTAVELSKVETLQRDLIANVSHDLRTPLTMITGYSEVIRDLPGENTPENVQVIIDEANRLTTLVNDMLDLSKLQSGTLTLNRSVFNLTQSVRRILQRYNKLTDYTITFSAPEEIEVYADELKISQVVYNLINNAITYTGEDKTVKLVQTICGGQVRISVSDTGEGIPQDKLKDIWQRYYKLDKAHKRAQVGTGLGLSIVKMILDLHRGRYGVQSQEGVGSTFWFELQPAPYETKDKPNEA